MDVGTDRGGEMIYTARQAAAMLDCAPRTVRNWARRLRLPLHGNSYMVTTEHMDRLRSIVRSHPGRPPRDFAAGVEYLADLIRRGE